MKFVLVTVNANQDYADGAEEDYGPRYYPYATGGFDTFEEAKKAAEKAVGDDVLIATVTHRIRRGPAFVEPVGE